MSEREPNAINEEIIQNVAKTKSGDRTINSAISAIDYALTGKQKLYFGETYVEILHHYVY